MGLLLVGNFSALRLLPTLPPPECKLPEAQNCDESISGPWGSPSWVLCRAGVQNKVSEKPAEVTEKTSYRSTGNLEISGLIHKAEA